MSPPPPAAEGRRKVMGLLGYSEAACACATAAIKTPIAMARFDEVLMRCLLPSF
jgi:hypothetical protein